MVQKRGIMGIKKKIAAALGILAAVLVSGSVSSPVYAEQNRGEVMDRTLWYLLMERTAWWMGGKNL